MNRYIDNDAREWLELIDAHKRELDKTVSLQKEEAKRREKLRSPKFVAQSDALLESYAKTISRCTTFVEEHTSEFFKAVLGVLQGAPAALHDATGKPLGALLAQQMTARLLKDGSAVFTLAGDSLDKDLLPGLPQSNYLLAEENKGHRFVPLA